MVKIDSNPDENEPKNAFSSNDDAGDSSNLEIKSKDLKPDKFDSEDLKGKFTGFLLFCLSMAVIGAAFQVGWSIGLYNTPIDVIRNFFETTYEDRYDKKMTNGTFDLLWSITNGLLPLGAAFGGISSGVVADLFGRKYGLLFTNIFVVACGCLNIMSKFIKSYETIMVARFLSGIFCGLFTGILPLYLSELPPQNYRGLVGTMNQFGIVLGILTTNTYGLSEVLGTDDRWPILVGFMLIPVITHIILIIGVDSPKYLYVTMNKKVEAEQVLTLLRGKNERALIERELILLENEKVALEKLKQVSWTDLISKPALRHPLFIAVGVHFCQQFSGINAVIFYSTKIFTDVGLDGSWPSYATIILGVVQLVMTLVCLFIIDKAGRKFLLLIGMIGMCISSFALALFRIFGNEDRQALNYLTIVSAVAYIIFFSIGPGAIPWLLTSELFNSEARSKANSVAVLVNWGCAFIVTVTFPFLERAIGNYSFILFGGLLILFSLFMLFFVPETKNKTTEEITAMLGSQTIFLFESSNKKNETITF